MLDINVSISSWSKWKHNELKSTSSLDAQSLFRLTESESNGNAGRKQNGQCDLSLSQACSASLFEQNSRHGVDKAVFKSDLVKLKQKTRSIRGRTLSKEESDSFHTLTSSKYDDHCVYDEALSCTFHRTHCYKPLPHWLFYSSWNIF